MRRRTAPIDALLALLRGARPGEAVNRKPMDWEAIVAQANRSLTTPALATRLAAVDPALLPADLVVFLQDVLARNERRNRLLLDQCEEVLTLLNAGGIVPTLHKGVALLLGCPPSMRSRLVSDLDLGVPPHDWLRALALLEAGGYAVHAKGANRVNELTLDLVRADRAAMIDLHRVARGPDDLTRRLSADHPGRPVQLGAGQALLPSPTRLFVELVLHDQFHDGDFWRGHLDLRHLLDMVMLAEAEAEEPLDFAAVIAAFLGARNRTILTTQLITASRLLGLPLPDGLAPGWFARLQYRRRRLQLRHGWTGPALSLLTSALHPRRTQPGDAAAPARPLRRLRARLGLSRALFRRASLGKV